MNINIIIIYNMDMDILSELSKIYNLKKIKLLEIIFYKTIDTTNNKFYDSHWDQIKFNQYKNNSKFGWKLDHIIPRKKGGLNILENTQPLHIHHNHIKNNNKRFLGSNQSIFKINDKLHLSDLPYKKIKGIFPKYYKLDKNHYYNFGNNQCYELSQIDINSEYKILFFKK